MIVATSTFSRSVSKVSSWRATTDGKVAELPRAQDDFAAWICAELGVGAARSGRMSCADLAVEDAGLAAPDFDHLEELAA